MAAKKKNIKKAAAPKKVAKKTNIKKAAAPKKVAKKTNIKKAAAPKKVAKKTNIKKAAAPKKVAKKTNIKKAAAPKKVAKKTNIKKAAAPKKVAKKTNIKKAAAPKKVAKKTNIKKAAAPKKVAKKTNIKKAAAPKKVAKSKFDFIDLFAGIGGMRLAFEAVGGQCVLTCEIDEAALTTYQANFNPKHEHTYVRDINDAKKLPPHKVLVAGFPCQPYSIAGLRKGLKDARGQVFLEIIRILKSSKPQAFLLENVKGMRTHDGGRTFEYMREQLESCGYSIQDKTLNSAVHANVPQNRERVFVVGFLDKKKAGNFRFPEPISLTKTIKSFIIKSVSDNRYFYDSRFDCFTDIKKVVTSPDTVYQWRRKYVRENKNNVCPALTANMGSGGHNVPLIRVDTKIRKLTPRECANFQGFPRGKKGFVLPKDLSDSSLYHQFGNSVTVPLIERIAAAMTEVM